MHSQEEISFLPKYAYRVPFVAQAVRQQERNYRQQWGRELDYTRVYWTPPHPAREALTLERQQVEALDLDPLVSLTDHDQIEACVQLQVLDTACPVPISTEWTVPFGPSYIHLGVHNLPPRHCRELTGEMARYTRNPAAPLLRDILVWLNRFRDVLVVHNHPLWDEHGIGDSAHREMMRTFLSVHGSTIHALELNGLRSWAENRAVCSVARETGHPVIAGGDRHGGEPNANINLTNAGTFAEFVEEIRFDRVSDVLFMPQYREGRRIRYCETLWDVLRDYPEYPNRVRWSDRVFLRQDNGIDAPVSNFWAKGDPKILSWFKAAVELFRQPTVRSVLRLALAERQEFA